MKKGAIPNKSESDDTEGTDHSYESSIDEKEDKIGLNKDQKNINLFKEQMVRFLLTHPELQDDIKFTDTPIVQTKNENQMGGGASGSNGGMGYNAMSTLRPMTAMISSNDTNKIQEKKGYRNNMWESIANNIMQESKRTGTMPSIENFSQRLNLFRKKIEKPDVIEIILQNKDSLLKQIKKEEERKAKIQNRIHETIEAKLRKEQGDVKYYSKLKKNQFDSRMQKEEARVRQNRQTNNNNNNNNTNTYAAQNININNNNNNNNNQNAGNQQYMGEKSGDKRNSLPFNTFFQGQNNNYLNPGTPQGAGQNLQFSSPQQQQKYMLQNSSSQQVLGTNSLQSQQQQTTESQERKLKQQRSMIMNNQNQQMQSISRLGVQGGNPNVSFNHNNMSAIGMQQQANNLLNQKNQKNLRFQTPPTQYLSPPQQLQQPQINLRQELENRIMNSTNPIIKDNFALNMKIQLENQKQFKTFKARPVPGVFERLSQDVVKKNQQTEVEIDIPLDIEFKTAKGEQLYREIRKKDDEEEIKRHVIKFLLEHRQKAEDEFKIKPSLLSQGQKYYSEESKEFSLLSPNFQAKKKMQEMMEKGQLTDDFFEHRANLEEGNVYLLTKVSKILKGNIMKKWKSIQDSKF